MAGTTPVLSTRSSLFLFRRLSRACEDRVAHWQFLALSVGAIYGKENSGNHITTSQTKSFMVLTRLMATNNHTGEEPCIIALERQVQTLVVAVERITKKKHNLEEQLRQRDAGPNSYEEEQKDTSA